MRQRFHGCEPKYIRDVCHAACCRSSTHPTGIRVTIHRTERAALEARGATVTGGYLEPRPGEHRCPFQTDTHLCALHGGPDKPFGCMVSPFTLAPGGRTLIVRNRYRLLVCYRDDRDGPAPPAYIAFRWSLEQLLGADETARICAHLEAGGGDTVAAVPADHYRILADHAETRRKHG
jgi:hypothetical protein